MDNWTQLKDAVAQIIKTNDNQDITAVVLRDVLFTIINIIGENATLAGFATPTTAPGVPDGKVFYFAFDSGLYANFSGINIENPGLIILYNTGGDWEHYQVYQCLQDVGDSQYYPMSQAAITIALKNMQVEFDNKIFPKIDFSELDTYLQNNWQAILQNKTISRVNVVNGNKCEGILEMFSDGYLHQITQLYYTNNVLDEETNQFKGHQDTSCFIYARHFGISGGTQDNPAPMTYTNWKLIISDKSIANLTTAISNLSKRIDNVENSRKILTQEEYDALTVKDENTLYYIYE